MTKVRLIDGPYDGEETDVQFLGPQIAAPFGKGAEVVYRLDASTPEHLTASFEGFRSAEAA